MSQSSIALSKICAGELHGALSLGQSGEYTIIAPGDLLAEKVTKKASRQTYTTIRLLADRPLAPGAYRAYAYFRWVDDVLDLEQTTKVERLVFLARQQSIIRRCYEGDWPGDLCPEERLVAELIESDRDRHSGLHTYICEMMAVMAFDAGRKGRLISQAELDDYTRCLATAVTEALHYFIGRACYVPSGEARYLAVTAAHTTHMLRDTVEDTENGYFNISIEYLEAQGICAKDVNSPAYQAWVEKRVKLARALFVRAKVHVAQVENLRCRLAGYAYIARFEVVLDAIERDGYCLRAAYPERKSKHALLKMAVTASALLLKSLVGSPAPIKMGTSRARGIV